MEILSRGDSYMNVNDSDCCFILFIFSRRGFFFSLALTIIALRQYYVYGTIRSSFRFVVFCFKPTDTHALVAVDIFRVRCHRQIRSVVILLALLSPLLATLSLQRVRFPFTTMKRLSGLLHSGILWGSDNVITTPEAHQAETPLLSFMGHGAYSFQWSSHAAKGKSNDSWWLHRSTLNCSFTPVWTKR